MYLYVVINIRNRSVRGDTNVMPIHQCKLFNYRMPPRILQHIQWCQLQFTMWLSILRRSVWGCLLLLQEGLPPRLRVSCDQWVPIWYSASLILVKFFCVLIFALITLLYSVDRNYVKKYVLPAYGFKVFTKWYINRYICLN